MTTTPCECGWTVLHLAHDPVLIQVHRPDCPLFTETDPNEPEPLTP